MDAASSSTAPKTPRSLRPRPNSNPNAVPALQSSFTTNVSPSPAPNPATPPAYDIAVHHTPCDHTIHLRALSISIIRPQTNTVISFPNPPVHADVSVPDYRPDCFPSHQAPDDRTRLAALEGYLRGRDVPRVFLAQQCQCATRFYCREAWVDGGGERTVTVGKGERLVVQVRGKCSMACKSGREGMPRGV